ncbi:hypothetical protein ACJX0J_033012 [Zea mays]
MHFFLILVGVLRTGLRFEFVCKVHKTFKDDMQPIQLPKDRRVEGHIVGYEVGRCYFGMLAILVKWIPNAIEIRYTKYGDKCLHFIYNHLNDSKVIVLNNGDITLQINCHGR